MTNSTNGRLLGLPTPPDYNAIANRIKLKTKVDKARTQDTVKNRKKTKDPQAKAEIHSWKSKQQQQQIFLQEQTS